MTKARNYAEVSQAVKNLQTFTHTTCSGEHVKQSTRSYGHGRPDLNGFYERLNRVLADHDDTYVLWSYAVPVGYVVEDRFEVTDRKFSVTTSKHQNKFRHALTQTGLTDISA